ncbi:BACON domain-containing protein [Porphyromonas macacae]|uniref:BACON domain-containing protein n=1 Tax=Porphyromonas macacae TaxID=28115 RepID=UPI00138B03BB|nr:BACON domain-containing protein [Porphyromonas macacae]
MKEDPISMTLSETKLTYAKDGGSKIVNVLGNAEGEITWSELPGGIEIVKDGNDLTITAASNPTPYEWEKEIFIIRGGISVPLLIKKKAGDVHIDTDEKELELSNRAGSKYSIPIKTNAKEITIKEKVSWVEASLSKDNILFITSTDNPSKEERSGKIVLMAEGKDFEISITQLGVPYIELSVSEITFPMEGGEKKIRFKMNRSMEALEGTIRKNDEISVHVSFKESTIIVKTARTFRKKEMIWDIPIGFVDEYGETKNQILRVKQAPDTREEDLKKILEEFYYAMDGKHWKNNTNWLSNKSPDEWYGIIYDDWNELSV